MANEKIIAQDVFEQSIKDILTLLVNNTYNFTEYTDEEVGNLIDLDPTQIAELTAVISDSVVAKNKVFSSSHTTELIQKSVIESNEYADSLVANLSNIKLDIVDTLPDASTVNKSTIYILKDSTGGTNNTLNVWSDSTSAFVEVGKLSVNMDNYYTKSEIDTELDKKANADEVLKPDAIVSDLTTTSGSTTLSTVGLQTELDKKANDDEVVKTADIATSIDSTSTDTQVPSAKATWDSLYKICDTQVLVDANNPTSKICMADLTTLNTPSKEGITSAESSLIISIEGRDYWNGQISITMAEPEVYVRSVREADTWTKWRKLCTTSVEDVPVTTLTVNSWASGTITYCVRNGICFVHVTALISNTMSTANQELASGLPKPLFADKWYSVASNTPTQGSLFVHLDVNGKLTNHVGIDNSYYFGSFSYVVAES